VFIASSSIAWNSSREPPEGLATATEREQLMASMRARMLLEVSLIFIISLNNILNNKSNVFK
jgi:hypothetical protein